MADAVKPADVVMTDAAAAPAPTPKAKTASGGNKKGGGKQKGGGGAPDAASATEAPAKKGRLPVRRCNIGTRCRTNARCFCIKI